MVTIGRSELYQLVSFLNLFGAFPREDYLGLGVRSFCYIKTTIHKQTVIDSRRMQFTCSEPNFKKLIPDSVNDYPDVGEELNQGFLKVFDPVLETTFLVDSDHAHGLVIRWSLTGLIGYVGSTPILWFSHRQGSIASSTYMVEFLYLHTEKD